MRDGRASVFMGMGGNFAMATPDTAVTEAALRSCALTVQVSTKLNRSHLVHRTDRADPAVARAHRQGPAVRRQTASVGRGFDVDGASVARQPATARRAGAQRGRDRLRAGPSRAGRRAPGAVGAVPPRLRPHPRRDRRRGARLRGLQPPGPPARRLPAAPPAARLPRIPHHHGQGQLRGQPAAVDARAGGSPDAADAAQPRPVQHHHLRPRRPLPRGQGRPPGGLRQPGRHRGVRLHARATASTWSPNSPTPQANSRNAAPRTS